jgi:hypothetical protein
MPPIRTLYSFTYNLANRLIAMSWPALRVPVEYLKPYAQRADEIGDKTLTRIDERFPAVKKPTDELVTDLREGVLQYPAAQTLEDLRRRLFELYGEEYKKAGGEGLPSMARGAVNTSLIIGNETLAHVLAFLSQKRQEGEGIIDGATEKVRQAVSEARGTAHEAKEGARQTANDSIDGNWD